MGKGKNDKDCQKEFRRESRSHHVHNLHKIGKAVSEDRLREAQGGQRTVRWQGLKPERR